MSESKQHFFNGSSNTILDDSVLQKQLLAIAKNSKKILKLSDAQYGIYIPNLGCFDIEKSKEEILGSRLFGNNMKVISAVKFGLHFKYNPKNVINEKIAYLLDKLLFKTADTQSNSVVNPNQAVIVKCKDFSNLVLASQTVIGSQIRELLVNNDLSVLQNISPDNFSRLFILHLLLRPGDGKTDNFILGKDNTLVGIDHENIFADDAVYVQENENEFSTTHIASLVFLLDQYFPNIDRTIKSTIINTDIESLIFTLLNDLEQYANPNDFSRPEQWCINLSFEQDSIARLYKNLKTIQAFCLEHNDIQTTHEQLLEVVNSNLYRFYREYKEHAHQKHLSIEKMMGAVILQGSPEKNKDISFEKLGLRRPTYKRIATQIDIITRKKINLDFARQEFINEIDYRALSYFNQKAIFNYITKYAPRLSTLNLTSCTIDKSDLNQLLQLPIKKLILNGVRLNPDDLNYFIQQSRAYIELYQCPSFTYHDLNKLAGRQSENTHISIRVNKSLIFSISPINQRNAANYLFQFDQHTSQLALPHPSHLSELRKYLLANKFYLYARAKLVTDYPNGGIDEFVQHTLQTLIKWINMGDLSDRERIGINRNTYKVLHWRHQKLFIELIKVDQLIPNEAHRHVIEHALSLYRKEQLSSIQSILDNLEATNQKLQHATKAIYLYKNQCTSIANKSNELLTNIQRELSIDCFLHEQYLLPVLETFKDIHDLISTCALTNYRRILSLKFLSGAAFEEKHQLLEHHFEIFFSQSTMNLRERLADKQYDLANIRGQLGQLTEFNLHDHAEHIADGGGSLEAFNGIQNQYRSAIEHTIDQCAQHNITVNSHHIPLQEVTILRLVNHDAYSEVYLAEYQYTPVLVKKLTLKNTTQKSKFERDIHLRKNFRHRNIAELLGIDDSSDNPVMIINTDSTKTLKKYLTKTLLNDQQKLQLALGVARALYHIHEVHNIAHGNLCSQNILISESGEPLLDNFGFAVGDTPTLLPTSAYNNAVIKYFPPEANHRCLTARPTIDIYCFGILLCEIYSAQGQCLPMPIKEIGEGKSQPYFPKIIADLIQRCTQTLPNNRPNICQVIEDLQTYRPLTICYQSEQIDRVNELKDRADQIINQIGHQQKRATENNLTHIRHLFEAARRHALLIAQQTGSYRAYCIVGNLNIQLLCEMNRLFGNQFTSDLEVNKEERICNAFKFFNLTKRYYSEYPKAKKYLQQYAQYDPHRK